MTARRRRRPGPRRRGGATTGGGSPALPVAALLLALMGVAGPLAAQQPCPLPADLAAGLDTLAAEAGDDEPVRVILMVGDGVGAGYWTAARLRRSELATFGLPTVGFLDTRNAHGRVTDSAASGTALATGCLTYNGAIAMGPDTAALTSVTEIARGRGLATGLVTTSRVTHATPAVFAAHVADRDREEEIAAQMAGAGLDALLGGGRRYFRAETRDDDRDVLGRLREDAVWLAEPTGLEVFLERAGAGPSPAGPRRLVGLFADDDLPPAPERGVSLAAMTRAALSVLDRDPDGFLLVVEAAQPDWRGHDAAPLSAVQAEMLDFDDAVRAARAYRDRRLGTVLVVLADHETGGLAVAGDTDGGLVERWASGGAGDVTDHTANLVPHFAAGPGTGSLRGVHTPASVGRWLLRAVGGPAVAETLERAAAGAPGAVD